MNDEYEIRMVRKRKGTKRPSSRNANGLDRDMLYDRDGKLLGPTESKPADLDELVEDHLRAKNYATDATGAESEQIGQTGGYSPTKERIRDDFVDFLVEFIVTTTEKTVFPAVKNRVYPWAKRNVRNGIKKVRTKFDQSRETRKKAESENETTTVPPTHGADFEILGTTSQNVMNVDEYLLRLQMALAAEEFAAEQRATLAKVDRLVGEQVPEELLGAMNLMLEGAGDSIDPGTYDALVEFLRQRMNATSVRLETQERHVSHGQAAAGHV